MDKEKYLKEQRMKRIQKLSGKYVIICDSKNKDEILYLQDQKLSKASFWTIFLANAKGFDTKQDALNMLKKLKYNNPRLAKIQ